MPNANTILPASEIAIEHLVKTTAVKTKPASFASTNYMAQWLNVELAIQLDSLGTCLEFHSFLSAYHSTEQI